MPTSTHYRNFEDTLPERGLHLLDASMFWGPSGGVRRVITTRHQQLAHFGWRHTVLAPGCSRGGVDHLDVGGWSIPASGGYRFVTDRAGACERIVRAQPDVIESADPYVLAWAVLDAGRRLNAPTLAFCHSNLPSVASRLAGSGRTGAWASRAAQRYLVDLYRRFDAVLAPSEHLAERLRGWGLPDVAVQPLGVDCSVFRPAAADPAWRHDLCTELGLPLRTRLFVYTGRFAPEKRLPLLARAVERLGAGHALVLLGDGPVRVSGSRVFVLPPQRDPRRVARLVASADAYVHAGDEETFGLGVLEAMACGTPVVVPAAAGLQELVHRVGITVGRSGEAAWADALQAALSGAAREMAASGLQRARCHDWPLVIAQMVRRYQALALQPRSGLTPPQATGPVDIPLPLPRPAWSGRPASLARVSGGRMARPAA